MIDWKPTPEDIARAVEMAKEIDRDAPRRPLGKFIAELRRKQVAAWQPIDTAPKDGTRVLLYAPTRPHDGAQQVGCFLPPAESGDKGCWWIADGRYQDWPTHWQPLPSPPKVE